MASLDNCIENVVHDDNIAETAPVERRSFIDNSIFQELTNKYPPVKRRRSGTNSNSLKYFTLENIYFSRGNLRIVAKEHSKAIIAYLFLRSKMCDNGWNLKWDTEMQEDMQEQITLWGVPEEEFESLLEVLLEKKLLIKVHNDKDKCDYLTSIQQIYNWEQYQARKKGNREAAARRRNAVATNQNEEATANEETATLADDLPFNVVKGGYQQPQQSNEGYTLSSTSENEENLKRFGIDGFGDIDESMFNSV